MKILLLFKFVIITPVGGIVGIDTIKYTVGLILN